MNRFRILFALVAGWSLLCPELVPAADPAPPFTMEKHYSADVIISTKKQGDIGSKAYVDGDKMRSDISAHGMDISIIVRKDKQKIYQMLAAQKLAMELPYDPSKFKGADTASFGPQGKFVLVGPDMVNGIACTKYKVTPDTSKETYYLWIDAARGVPVQMTDDAGSFRVVWKNFKAGPQDPTLFEVPADFTVMPMSNPPGTEMPGASGPGAPNSP